MPFKQSGTKNVQDWLLPLQHPPASLEIVKNNGRGIVFEQKVRDTVCPHILLSAGRPPRFSLYRLQSHAHPRAAGTRQPAFYESKMQARRSGWHCELSELGKWMLQLTHQTALLCVSNVSVYSVPPPGIVLLNQEV